MKLSVHVNGKIRFLAAGEEEARELGLEMEKVTGGCIIS
jgi:hypothetical protein